MILLDEQLSKNPAQIATVDEAIDIIGKLENELQQSKTLGIGLAAPQIGIDKAVAIIRINNPFDATNPYFVNLVNPKLIYAEEIIEYDEGCLSFPGSSAHTVRFNNITIESNSDYEYYARHIHAKRYAIKENIPINISNERRLFDISVSDMEHPKIQELSLLLSVCIQHEFSHLLGLTMFDFSPEQLGRNDKCPCMSAKKNKKCHNYLYYNTNLNKLFNPNYRGL